MAPMKTWLNGHWHAHNRNIYKSDTPLDCTGLEILNFVQCKVKRPNVQVQSPSPGFPTYKECVKSLAMRNQYSHCSFHSSCTFEVHIDACHEKTDLKAFVVFIPKEGWARMAAPILLLVRHRPLENMIYEVKRLKF